MPKKSMLIFSTAYYPLIGGAEIAVKEITDRITDLYFVMITARLDASLKEVERIGNIEVHRIGKGNKWDKFRLIWQGPKLARQFGNFDAVWSIMASYAGFAALRFKKKNPSTPFLLTLQEGDSKWHIYKHVWWCWWYFKQIFKRADRIQAISNYLAEWARELGAKCPVEVVPNGVDLGKFQITNNKYQTTASAGSRLMATTGSRPAGGINSKFQIGENTKLVITASRLVRKNGVADLIRAFQFLPENVHLLVAGTGELASHLQELARELKLENRVRFLGNISHDELPAYLSASDVFCRPSLSEGLGNSFLEAMAADVPIVGTKVGGIPDFLKDGETGLFCKVGDPEDIARQIKRILDDQSLAEKLRTNGKKLVEEKYSWNGIAKQMNTIFVQL